MHRLFGITFIIFMGIFASFAGAAEKASAKLQAAVAASPQQKQIVWVYFSDKGQVTSADYQNAASNLTVRAQQRRLKTRGPGDLVDFRDLPVYQPYLQVTRQAVAKIRHKSRWFNAVSAEIYGQEQLTALAAQPFVRKIDLVFTARQPIPDLTPQPLPPAGLTKTSALNYGASLTQNQQIATVEMHNAGYDGSGILIGMLDSGYNNFNHPAMQHLNIVATWDFINGDSIITDQSGQIGNHNHGTYTLSSLAGYFEGELIGPAYNADFALAKTEIADFERNIEEDHWVAGIEWADSLGADIVSSSLGYLDFDFGQNSYTWQDLDGNTALTTVAADLAASRGILVVNSAGNSGPAIAPANTLGSPADGDSVLTAGAVDALGNRAGFSSMGPTADGRIKPDVMAMGVSTVVISATNPTGYIALNGTSFSCPLTAGAAALIMQANPTWTNMDVINAMRSTAHNAATPDNSYGWGILNTHAAAFNATAIADPQALPRRFTVEEAYPNPFNPSTTLRFALPVQDRVTATVYNTLGQKIATLADGAFYVAGQHTLTWKPQSASSGLYFIVLEVSGQRQVRKAMLLK